MDQPRAHSVDERNSNFEELNRVSTWEELLDGVNRLRQSLLSLRQDREHREMELSNYIRSMEQMLTENMDDVADDLQTRFFFAVDELQRLCEVPYTSKNVEQPDTILDSDINNSSRRAIEEQVTKMHAHLDQVGELEAERMQAALARIDSVESQLHQHLETAKVQRLEDERTLREEMEQCFAQLERELESELEAAEKMNVDFETLFASYT